MLAGVETWYLVENQTHEIHSDWKIVTETTPSSGPSPLAGSTHSDVSPWSLHQKNTQIASILCSKQPTIQRWITIHGSCILKGMSTLTVGLNIITQTPQRQFVFEIATRIRSSWCSSWFSRVMCLDDSIGDDVDMNMKTQPYDWRKRTWTENVYSKKARDYNIETKLNLNPLVPFEYSCGCAAMGRTKTNGLTV